KKFILIALLCSIAFTQEVKILTSSNFDQETKGLWFIKFYAPWCGHCTSLSPTWSKLAAKMDGTKINIGKVNCDENSGICSRFGVQGYPTLILVKDGYKVIEYEGGRAMDSFVSFLSDATTELKNEGKVVDLTTKNFDLMTIKPNTRWFIKFFTDWCGHCKALAPTWDALAEELKGTKTIVGSVDCTKESSLCQRFDVKGYPTLNYLFNPNKYTKYRSGRTLDQLKSFALEGYKQNEALERPMPLAPSFFESLFTNPMGILLAVLILFMVCLILVAICVCCMDTDSVPPKKQKIETKPLIPDQQDEIELPDVDPSEMDSKSEVLVSQSGVDLKRRTKKD
ncbi:thioredoxin domain-containing protein, partial [Acrasis kona]